jgi:hypothetical protein
MLTYADVCYMTQVYAARRRRCCTAFRLVSICTFVLVKQGKWQLRQALAAQSRRCCTAICVSNCTFVLVNLVRICICTFALIKASQHLYFCTSKASKAEEVS